MCVCVWGGCILLHHKPHKLNWFSKWEDSWKIVVLVVLWTMNQNKLRFPQFVPIPSVDAMTNCTYLTLFTKFENKNLEQLKILDVSVLLQKPNLVIQNSKKHERFKWRELKIHRFLNIKLWIQSCSSTSIRHFYWKMVVCSNFCTHHTVLGFSQTFKSKISEGKEGKPCCLNALLWIQPGIF